MINNSIEMHHIEQTLRTQGYVVSERWDINDVLRFIRRELSHRGIWLGGFQVFLFGLILLGLYLGYLDISKGLAWFKQVVAPFSLGVVLMIVLVVPHELLHGLAYKVTGAKRIKYGADWTKLVFHASAPYHAIGYKQMLFVALTPFVVITSLVVYGLFLVQGGFYWWFLFGVLVMHTQGCFGDFAMVNFFQRQDKAQDWVTYDDSDNTSFVLLFKE